MEEIFSEGQRRIRSKHVSLPYHRPKQRSLDEFLQRRSLVAAVPLRTAGDELKEVWKQIEEKEKDAEIFYKSEDESENEDSCEPSEKNTKDSQTQEALNPDTSSNENDLNVINTAGKEDKTTDCPSDDKASPIKSNTAGNLEQTESTVDVSAQLSEKFKDSASAESSQCEDSASFSLKLSEKWSDVNSAESGQCEDSAPLSLRLPDSNESGCTESVKAVDPLATDSIDKFCSNVNTSPKKNSNESHPEDALVDKETDLKINEKVPSFDAQKVDETAAFLKDTETQEKDVRAEEKDQDSNSNSCKESPKNPEVSEKEKVDENDKPVSDLMPESDPTFSLQLEESQDGLETRGNAGFKGTEEEKTAVKDKAADKKESSAKIDWMKSMKFSSDEDSDNEAAPKITLKSNSQDIILLDEPIQRVNPGVAELMEKFYKHSSFKNVHKKKQSSVQMSIVTTSKNEDNKISGFHSETLTVDVEEEVAVGPKNEKPGAKLTKLKLELREQMAKRRQEEWQKRLLEHKVNEEDVDDEKSDCGALLDDDDDYVPPGTESEDSDLEENDIDLSDKKKKKSAFVDDEAEEDEEDEEAEENDEDTELSSCKQKTKDLSKEKVIIEDDEYEGDDDDDENDDDNDNNEDESNDEDDDWMQPGQTKLRSQLTPCILTNNPTGKVDDICLDESKFNASFDLSKFGSFTDDLASNKTLNHEISGMEKLINVKNSDNTTDSQVLELCSGKFQTQPPQIEEETDDFVLSPTQDKSQSQSLTAKKPDPFLSSDDEDGMELTMTRKKKIALKISDDEDETNDSKKEGFEKESNVESEKEDLEGDDNVNEDVDFPEENEEHDDNRSVMYDSEENEVIVTKKDVGQFFDKEAELSGSDVESEDEDEKGLDRMDEELGDQEQIDEDEAREELGKIHMRNLLDDDQRDIKALQERFLEDGELHSDGKGREKNFRWQNINDEALDAIWRERRNSDCEEQEEEEQGADESEQLWQRMREEKEAFLKKHKKAQSNVDEDLDEEALNQIVQKKSIGEQTPSTKTPVIKAGAVVSTEGSRFSSINPDPKKLIDLNVPILEKSLTPASILQTSHLYARKGSFLSRSAQILSRVGPIQSAVSTEPNINQKAKNTRNFVFAVKSPTKEDFEDSQDSSNINKRKSAPVSPVANKKPKFMEKKKVMPSKCKSLLSQLSALDKEAVR